MAHPNLRSCSKQKWTANANYRRIPSALAVRVSTKIRKPYPQERSCWGRTPIRTAYNEIERRKRPEKNPFFEMYVFPFIRNHINVSGISSQGGNITMARNRNNLLASQARGALEQMKYEIATEFGVQLGPDTTSRQNGSVGGEITKRLVMMAEQQLGGGRMQ